MKHHVYAALFLALQLTQQTLAQAQLADVCDGEDVRPVLLVPGFQGSPLYNASNGYSVEWIDVKGTVTNSIDVTDLGLPIEWDDSGNTLQQAQSDVGVKSGPNDVRPSVDGPVGQLILQPLYGDLQEVAESFVHPTNESLPMFYSVAWDWRRDLWEQSARVLQRVQYIYNTTQCRPLVVAHSYGGRLTYTTLGRYGEDAARYMAAILYATSALDSSAALSPGTGEGFDIGGRPLANSRVFFTWASAYGPVPQPTRACYNTDTLMSETTRECNPAALQTGITCSKAACGRPADWPQGTPFFLPFDLQNATVWEQVGLGLSAARARAGEPRNLNARELQHVENALATSDRVANLFIGEAAARIKALHPPGAVLSIAIDSDDISNEFATQVVPGGSSTRVATAVECEPSENFAAANPPANAPRCSNLTLVNMVVGDGLLPSYMHTPPGQWGDVLQVFTITEIIPRWSAITASPLAASPHSVALQLGDEGSQNCDGVAAPTGGEVPTLRGLLCSLVQRAALPANATAPPPVSTGNESPNVVEQVLEGSAQVPSRRGAWLALFAACIVAFVAHL